MREYLNVSGVIKIRNRDFTFQSLNHLCIISPQMFMFQYFGMKPIASMLFYRCQHTELRTCFIVMISVIVMQIQLKRNYANLGFFSH